MKCYFLENIEYHYIHTITYRFIKGLINENIFRAIEPPPIRGKFVPISKWGPHDRYAPQKRKKFYLFNGTTTQKVVTTTSPHVTMSMKNTVIPLWLSNPKRKMITNLDAEERKTSDTIKEPELLPSPTEKVDDADKPSDNLAHLFTTLRDENTDKDKYSAYTSSSMSSGDDIEMSSSYSNTDNIMTTGSEMKYDLNHKTDSNISKKYTSISEYSSQATTSEEINSLYNEVVISYSPTIDLPFPPTDVKLHLEGEYEEGSTKFAFTNTTVANLKDTIQPEDKLYDNGSNSFLGSIDATTAFFGEALPSDPTAYTSNDPKLMLENGHGSGSEKIETLPSKRTVDKTDIPDDYGDMEDKSLEEIQDELIKLLDEMTNKYHKTTAVVI